MWGKKEPKRDPKEVAAEEARAALDTLLRQIQQNMAVRNWDAVDQGTLKTMQLLHKTSELAPVTQSVLAELHGRWGLVMIEQRRFEEAHKHLALAEQLFNVDQGEAVALAARDKITLEGTGPEIDLTLALAVLRALAESAVRIGDPNGGALLVQVVDVADMVGSDEERWEARERLATFTSVAGAWEDLLAIAKDMGRFAQEQRNLHYLLTAMRLFSESYIGIKEMDKAIAAQRLVVDIARFIQDSSLATEEAELSKLHAAL